MTEDSTEAGLADQQWFSRPSVLDSELLDPSRRRANLLPENEDEPGPVVVELNVLHDLGLTGAESRLRAMLAAVLRTQARRPSALRISEGYWRCHLSVREIRRLASLDREASRGRRAIQYIWTDYLVTRFVDQSSRTVKAEAARRLFNADGRDIVWAVIDSGIAGSHPHFRTYETLEGEVRDLHQDFTLAAGDRGSGNPLNDPLGHGSHVAGIIAGGLSSDHNVQEIRIAEHVGLAAELSSDEGPFDLSRLQEHDPLLTSTRSLEELEERTIDNPNQLSGMARRCKLVSLRVLNENGTGRSSDVIRAMRYIREELNSDSGAIRIHGANLSLGYDFNAKAFACGQTPICVEVDRLVRSGVVVVAAAGNTGYGTVTVMGRMREAAFLSTINDPGNAALAITVGSTHREAPHRYGVSYFSSKGPTSDGRLKPDLLAPGERITSCAAGRKLTQAKLLFDAEIAPSSHEVAYYVDDSGTSMAAPHVSGAIAAFLSIRREFLNRPEEIKRIFLDSATSLGRERYFEGCGLVDLLRAIQRV